VPLLASVEVMSSTEQLFMETPIRKFRIDATLRPDADVRSIEPMRVARSAGGRATQASAGAPGGANAAGGNDARSILARFLSQRQASGPTGPGVAEEPGAAPATKAAQAAEPTPAPGPTASVNEQP
jgi:hypothetical protein